METHLKSRTCPDLKGRLFPNILDVRILSLISHFILECLIVQRLLNTDSHFSSVKRQLNLYGFRLIQRGDNKGYFFQPEYRRSDITTARNIVRIGAPKKRKFTDDSAMSACKRHTRRGRVTDDTDYAEEDAYMHVSSESEQDDNVCENIQTQHNDYDYLGREGGDEVSSTIPVVHTNVIICSSKGNCNEGNYNSNHSAFRPSALSSRLGFNMNLLNRFNSKSNPQPVDQQPNPNHPNAPVVVPRPDVVEASNEQDKYSQLLTYGDIDSTSSDLYAIGPSFPQDKMMITTSQCGYNVKAFNIDEMLEFLDTL